MMDPFLVACLVLNSKICIKKATIPATEFAKVDRMPNDLTY